MDDGRVGLVQKIASLLTVCEERPTADAVAALGGALRDHVQRDFGVLHADTRARLGRLLDGLPSPLQSTFGAVRGYLTLALLHRREKRFNECAGFARQGLLAARCGGDPVALAVATRIASIAESELGNLLVCMNLLLESSELEETPEYKASSYQPNCARMNILAHLTQCGQYNTAHRLLDQLLAARESRGVLADSFGLDVNAADIYLYRGDFRRGLRAIARGYEVLKRVGVGGADGVYPIYQTHALLLIETGQLAEADRVLAEGIADVRCKPTQLATGWLELVAGLLAVHQGEVDAGLQMVDAAAIEVTRDRPFSCTLDAALVAARAFEIAGQDDQARLRLARGVEHAQRLRGQQLRCFAEDDGGLREYEVGRRTEPVRRTPGDRRRRQLQNLAAVAEFAIYPCGRHLHRVGRLSELLAIEAGAGAAEAAAIAAAATLHDIGKIAISRELLAKGSRLTNIETDSLRQHACVGYELLIGVDRREYETAASVARSHHERWDGTGYPDRLHGEAIPLCARIVAIAEAYDAMTHDRPWAAARSPRDAMAEIQSLAGRQFDPRLARLFVQVVRRLHLATDDVDRHLSAGAEGTDLVSLQARLSADIAAIA